MEFQNIDYSGCPNPPVGWPSCEVPLLPFSPPLASSDAPFVPAIGT